MIRCTRKKQRQIGQAGFTIVETLIATVVFSSVLMVISYGVLRFTADYYHGVTSSAAQDAARSTLDTVTQAIQFSNTAPQMFDVAPAPAPAPPSYPSKYICTGSQVITATLGQMNDATATVAHQTMVSYPSSSCTYDSSDPRAHSLLGNHMRVTQFSVKSVGTQLWQVSVGVAYGSDDMFCYDTASCTENSPSMTATDFQNPDNLANLHCKPGSGNQYCSVSKLTATVAQRIGG